MNRFIRLDHLADHFPVAPHSAPPAANTFPLRLGSNLQNRLVTLALGLGARAARFDLTCPIPTLVVLPPQGKEIRTTITGAEWEWHAALDQFASLYDEDKRAGLNRFLGVRRHVPQAKSLQPETRSATRYFEQIMLLAA
jgi:hypothetical protein